MMRPPTVDLPDEKVETLAICQFVESPMSGPASAPVQPALAGELDAAEKKPRTLYVSYRQWFEIEYPDTESIPISIADVQPLHFATAAEAVEFKLIHCEHLTFYDPDYPQVRAFKAYLNRWPT